jgi:hypothetical protein
MSQPTPWRAVGPSFSCPPEEGQVIHQIAIRALQEVDGLHGRSLQDVAMDLTATHANGCRLRLLDLFDAEVPDLAHDVLGIARHLDRETGRLGGHFTPRYAAPAPASGIVLGALEDLVRDNPTPLDYVVGDLGGARCWVATTPLRWGPDRRATGHRTSVLEAARVSWITAGGRVRVELSAGDTLLFAPDGGLHGGGNGRRLRGCRLLAATPALDRAREAEDARARLAAAADLVGSLADADALEIDRAVSAALARAAEVRS